MGKMAMLLVLALMVTAGIVGYSLNQAKTYTIENVTGFVKYATARNIAHTGVNMMLRALDRNDTAIIGALANKKAGILSRSFMGGQCSVAVTLVNPMYRDTIDMTSRAKFMDTSKNMALRLRRQPVPFPAINAAVELRVPNVDFQMDGGPKIDGRNHDIDGNLLPPSIEDKPAVGVIGAVESTTVAGDYKHLEGTQDVFIDNGMSNPNLFVQDYINAADTVFTAGTYADNMQWGSAAAPKITFVDGTDGPVKFSGTIDGYGVLVVKGSIQVAGNFKFRGLVIGFPDVEFVKDTLSLTTGTPDIIGGLLMGGYNGSRFEMKGSDKIAYSKEALEMAKYINKLQVYRVIRWWE